MSMHKSPTMIIGITLFLILVAGTIYRINTALETHPGLVVEDAYASGESYGDTLEAKKQLAAQGYKLGLILPKVVTHQVEQTYRVRSTQHGKGVDGAQAIAYFYRPLEQVHDFSQPMQAQGNGKYETSVNLPLKGRWDVVVEVTKGDYLQRASAKMFAQ